MAYRPSTDRPGGRPILASFCAGPALLLVVSLAVLTLPGVDASAAGAMIVAIPLAIVIGFALAIVPNVICTTALRALGERNEATRLPVFWGLAGALLAGGIALALNAPPEAAGLFAATGAISALICRVGVDWDCPPPCPTSRRSVIVTAAPRPPSPATDRENAANKFDVV